MGSSKKVNIPVFIPHLGCPNNCVFCDQRAISRQLDFDISAVRRDINIALSTISAEKDIEIAFFGGSFTGIERSLMISLLDMAAGYVVEGRVRGIRLSTRPDYIDDEILSLLKAYSVTTIELGIQSMSDAVLLASKRGHDSKQSVLACQAVKRAGFNLIGQMMIGLPMSTPEDELSTAQRLCDLKADGVRIYPTAVLLGTELADMTDSGEYKPLTLEDAVLRAAGVMFIFAKFGVPVIRVGLCESEGLFGDVYAGVYHSAFGELVENELYYRLITEKLNKKGKELAAGSEIKVFAPTGSISKVVGHKRINKIKIRREYNVKNMKVIETDSLLDYNIIIT